MKRKQIIKIVSLPAQRQRNSICLYLLYMLGPPQKLWHAYKNATATLALTVQWSNQSFYKATFFNFSFFFFISHKHLIFPYITLLIFRNEFSDTFVQYLLDWAPWRFMPFWKHLTGWKFMIVWPNQWTKIWARIPAVQPPCRLFKNAINSLKGPV